MRNTLKAGTIALVLGTSLAGTALAHHPWVLAEPSRTEVGASVQVLPFFGHEFPYDGPMRADRIAELVLLSAQGEQIGIDPNDANTPALTEGVHVIGLRQARGYWSQTTEGGRPQPRSALDKVVSCGYSDNSAKTVLIVGEGGPSAAGRALGHRLEILSDTDLSLLAEADPVRVRVLFEGRAHHGPLMVFHADSGEDPYLVTETDAQGQAEIELAGSGPWLLLAFAEIDYPDLAVCDVERFQASLTFGLSGSN